MIPGHVWLCLSGCVCPGFVIVWRRDEAFNGGAMDGHDRQVSGGPLVSVLVCAYNAEAFIGATLRSVCAQTHRHMEILVLDNASADRTPAVVAELAATDHRIRLRVSKVNRGAYGGLNELLDQTQGRYVAIQDHDDLWHPDKIRCQVEYLEAHSDCVGCGTAILNHYEKYDRFLLRRQTPVSTIAWHTSLMFRRGAERYDTSVPVGTDFHFMREVLCRGRRCIGNLPEPYVLRRLRADGSNLSSQWMQGRGREIWRARLGWLDKLCLLNRLWLPADFVDRLVLGVFFRNAVRTRAKALADPVLKELVALAPGA